jgi:hypothetical protein
MDKHKIVQVENDRFTDSQGNPQKRYELIIQHVNNGKEQVWTISKTVCLAIAELQKGSRFLRLKESEKIEGQFTGFKWSNSFIITNE